MVIVSPLPTARGPLLVACKTDVNAAPCATGFGDFVLVIDRSLPSRWIVKFTNPELLVESGSALEALMEAVFVAAMPAGGTTVLSGAVAEIVMSSVAPTGKEAREQVTLHGTTDWTRLQVEADVPADSVFVLFGITLTGSGQVWAANVTLETV